MKAPLSVTGLMIAALDEGLDLGYGDVGLELVVLDLEIDVAPAQLVAKLLERKLKPVALLLTDDCRRPRQGCDQADLHLVGSLVLGVSDAHNETERRGRGDHSKQQDHVQLLRLKDFDPAALVGTLHASAGPAASTYCYSCQHRLPFSRSPITGVSAGPLQTEPSVLNRLRRGA
jgi:hypothetical protein